MKQTDVGRPGKKQNRQRNKEIGGFHPQRTKETEESRGGRKQRFHERRKEAAEVGGKKCQRKGVHRHRTVRKQTKRKVKERGFCVTSLFVDIRIV